MKKTILLVIGFDGMDYHLSKKTIEKHVFVNFEPTLKILKVKRAVTGPSWASFYTGLDEKAHGVVDSWGRRTDKSNSFSDIKDYVFWEIIKKNGYEILTENLPITPDGFPFDSDPKKDLVNWRQSTENTDNLGLNDFIKNKVDASYQIIRNIPFDKIIKKTRKDCFDIIDGLNLEEKELIFIQFSFLDRIGHRIGFMNDTSIKDSYELAFSLMDKLYGITNPKNLIVVSDHGFGPNKREHSRDYDAVLILNEQAGKLFTDHVSLLEMLKSCTKNNLGAIYGSLLNLYFRELIRRIYFQIKMLNIDYVEQTAVFDKILKMFNVDFTKPTRIQKKTEEQRTKEEKEQIEERLRSLGYID